MVVVGVVEVVIGRSAISIVEGIYYEAIGQIQEEKVSAALA